MAAFFALWGAVAMSATSVPSLVTGAPQPSPISAPFAAPADSPAIVRVWLSEVDMRPGDEWSGQITTTTNVASLEARVAIFSLNVRRTDYGQFAFSLRVPPVPLLYRGKRTLALIARNAGGDEVVEDFQIRLR